MESFAATYDTDIHNLLLPRRRKKTVFAQCWKITATSKIMSSNCKTSSNERRYTQMSLKICELQNAFENLNLKDKVNRKGEKKHKKISCKKFSTADSFVTGNLDQIAEYLLKSATRKVVIMAGAGISTPSGIPDFRSPGTGLYHNLQKYNLPYPEAIFDIDYFYMDQRPFFALAKEIYPGNFKPNTVHYFARLLHEKNKLLRIYTQNIDGLERISGIPVPKLVEAHGTFATASCLSCHAKYKGEKIKEEIFADKIPKCKQGNCKGIVKPDIVFFGEQLPEKFWYHVEDMKIADLLIVMGTSLTVEPFASIAEMVSRDIPRLLINRDSVGYFSRKNDVVEKGDVGEGVEKLVKKLGWESDLAQLIEDTEK